MTLLFDGTAKSTVVDFNQWNGGWHCTPRPDSLTIVPAPAGKNGLAYRFHLGPGPEYDCGSEQHDQIEWTGIKPIQTPEVWIGYSMMLAPDWQPSDGWENIGFSGGSSIYKLAGLGNTGMKIGIDNGAADRHMVVGVNLQAWTMGVIHDVGVWWDWLYHIKYAIDATGFLEIYLKKPGQADYVRVFQKTGIATWYMGFANQTPQNDILVPRLGAYRQATRIGNQTFYVVNPKVATTMEEATGMNQPQPEPQPQPDIIKTGFKIVGGYIALEMIADAFKR